MANAKSQKPFSVPYARMRIDLSFSLDQTWLSFDIDIKLKAMFYQAITHATGIQAKFAAIASIVSIYIDIWILIGVVYTFILADFYLGYKLSKKVKQQNQHAVASGKLESCKWWHTIIKGKDAAIFIALMYLADKYIFMGETAICQRTVTGFICGAEFWSMLENQAYLSDSKWAIWLRKYVRNKAEKHLGINPENEEE